MLITLSYRLPRNRAEQVLGTVTAYPLTQEFSDAWATLPVGQNGKQPRYSSLATGLCATTAQPVRLFGERDLAQGELDAGSRMLLLTSRPVDYRLPVAVKTWERRVRAGLSPPVLATLLPPPESARPLAKYVAFRPGACPEAPNWVFRTAAWQLMSSLAGTRLRLDGREPLTLRMDTDGSLLAWETSDLIANPAGTAYGMARITARLVTSPGTGDLIVCFSAHLSRIGKTWAKVRTAWIARDAPGTPLLRLPVRHVRRPATDPLAGASPWRQLLLNPEIPDIVAACELEPITLPDDLPPVPGSVRPQAPGNLRHPLGTGLGARFMFRLHEHITACLLDLEPLSLEQDKTITLARRDPDPALGNPAIGSTGYRHLTIACLYATSGARDRMLGALQALTGQQLMSLPDGEARPVTDRIAVIAFHRPDMLAHGHVNRTALLTRLLASPGLERGSDDLTCAWVETEYHPDVPIGWATDAKPQLRRILAYRQIPSQFLATEPLQLPSGARPRTDAAKSHAARSALHDLLRIAGIIDDRIPKAVTGPKLRHPLDRPALLVGIHARRQQTGDDDRPLVLVLTAIRATPDPDVPWHALMYSEKQRAWLRHAAGVADFHCGKIGDSMLGRTEEKAARTRDRVEQRLAQLAADNPGLPLVIFADGPSTRTIWSGLQDRYFGAAAMPGDSLRADGHDVAVVRSNHSGEIGRPVTRQGEGNTPGDPRQPAAPGRRIYQRTDTERPVWLFAGISRTYGAKGGDIGARYTRWTLPNGLSGKLRNPWHSYTATEIAVPCAGTWDPATLAALTARLSEQPVFWDGRVVYATPLHLAVTADKDHPDYRATAPQEADDETEEISLADEEIDDPWAGDPDQDDMADAVAELQTLGG
jgi:RNaseH domain of pPIWI_RE/pPIWI_RE module N-terminal domain/MID domain of pPIWI_RE